MSTENKQSINEDELENIENNTEEKQENQVEEKAEAEIQEEKYNELNNKFLRLYAEFENYRKRSNKEKLDLISTANEKLMLDIIPSIDDFERAIVNNETVNDIEAIKTGFNLIYDKMKKTLEAKGLKQMNAIGDDFDSDLHEAIANIPSDESNKGKIIDVVEKGYMLNDKVIRFAKVAVGQ